MDVGRRVGRGVILNDPIHVGEIQTTCSNVSAEENSRRGSAERVIGGCSGILREGAVELEEGDGDHRQHLWRRALAMSIDSRDSELQKRQTDEKI